jgi:predicted site-specific integrase-resolvase
VHRIVVEHRDRLGRLGSEYVQAALAGQGRELVVVDAAEVDDDLVRDMTGILTSRWISTRNSRRDWGDR